MAEVAVNDDGSRVAVLMINGRTYNSWNDSAAVQALNQLFCASPRPSLFAGVKWIEVGHDARVSEAVSPLILLAAVANLLAQEVERSEHQHLANERFRTDLRAFITRVEAELEARAGRRHLHLADEVESGVSEN